MANSFECDDPLQLVYRHCATVGAGFATKLGEPWRGFYPKADADTGTVTFVRIGSQAFAVTAKHVVVALQRQNSPKELEDNFFVPQGEGSLLPAPFVDAPRQFGQCQPDIALMPVSDDVLERLGKEAIQVTNIERPGFPVEFGAAVGFPTALKEARHDVFGERLALPHVTAVAHGITSDTSASRLSFFSELEHRPPVGSLSGMSGGPVFWVEGAQIGLLGFVVEALDVSPPLNGDSIFSGPRIHFTAEHAPYETLLRWAAHALIEWPKGRGELNQAARLLGY